ncbi:DUF368 domain-containing protein [bacterium]|nr:DUF368 domain-containing protein [candidate division CSSED10-310 bacterium]
MAENSTYPRLNLSASIIMFIKGALIGIANIIPGVSGGTFALILGIYERLLSALHSITAGRIKELLSILRTVGKPGFKTEISAFLSKMDVLFLICLAAGAGSTILSLSFVIDYLLVNHPGLTLSFFLGLLIPSISVPWKMMTGRKTAIQLAMMIPGIALTVAVSLAFGKIGGFGDNLIWSFLTGIIAISAMILPGISGSFVLLVMGQYQNILRKLQSIQTSLDIHDWIWLAVFGIGCLIGLLFFSKLLDILLHHKRNATLAFLIGLIIGSFWVLWPFKQYEEEMDLSHIAIEFRDRVSEKQDIRVATAPNTMPDNASDILWNGLVLCVGLVCAAGLNRFGGSEQTVKPSDTSVSCH